MERVISGATSDGNNAVIYNGVTFSVTSNLTDYLPRHYNAIIVTSKICGALL